MTAWPRGDSAGSSPREPRTRTLGENLGCRERSPPGIVLTPSVGVPVVAAWGAPRAWRRRTPKLIEAHGQRVLLRHGARPQKLDRARVRAQGQAAGVRGGQPNDEAVVVALMPRAWGEGHRVVGRRRTLGHRARVRDVLVDGVPVQRDQAVRVRLEG